MVPVCCASMLPIPVHLTCTIEEMGSQLGKTLWKFSRKRDVRKHGYGVVEVEGITDAYIESIRERLAPSRGKRCLQKKSISRGL